MRHAAASLLLGQGVSPKIVQKLLGHSDISMTLGLYVHVLPTMHQGAMALMDSLLYATMLTVTLPVAQG